MTPLELDDPLNAAPPPAPAKAPPPAPEKAPPQEKPPVVRQTPSRRARRGGGETSRTVSPSPQAGADGEQETWRSWGSGTRAQTYKLPDQLVEELDARTSALNLPIGWTVAAAVVAALDLQDDDLITLVERAEIARDRGRRAARRDH